MGLFDRLAKKPEPPRESFRVFESEVDGKRLVADINDALHDYRHKREFPWFLSISTPVNTSRNDGLPDQDEARALNDWEDKLEAEIERTARKVFAGRVSWNGHRELLFFVDDPSAAANSLQKLINERSGRPFAFECQRDETWGAMKVYWTVR